MYLVLEKVFSIIEILPNILTFIIGIENILPLMITYLGRTNMFKN